MWLNTNTTIQNKNKTWYNTIRTRWHHVSQCVRFGPFSIRGPKMSTQSWSNSWKYWRHMVFVSFPTIWSRPPPPSSSSSSPQPIEWRSRFFAKLQLLVNSRSPVHYRHVITRSVIEFTLPHNCKQTIKLLAQYPLSILSDGSFTPSLRSLPSYWYIYGVTHCLLLCMFVCVCVERASLYRYI